MSLFKSSRQSCGLSERQPKPTTPGPIGQSNSTTLSPLGTSNTSASSTSPSNENNANVRGPAPFANTFAETSVTGSYNSMILKKLLLSWYCPCCISDKPPVAGSPSPPESSHGKGDWANIERLMNRTPKNNENLLNMGKSSFNYRVDLSSAKKVAFTRAYWNNSRLVVIVQWQEPVVFAVSKHLSGKIIGINQGDVSNHSIFDEDRLHFWIDETTVGSNAQ